MSNIIIPWEKEDGSIVDMFWNSISMEDRIDIIDTVSSLPATFLKDKIIDAVNDNQIIIVDWETWSWKTTQIPKMFYDDNKSIIVSQPRVLSAMSNASRVAHELLSVEGDPKYTLWYWVWYRTWQWVSSKRLSPLSFHTDWLELMRQVVSWVSPDMLVLDEVHNFSIPTEILAMLSRSNKKIKLIIMSATLNPEIFQEYYKNVSSNIPVVKIPWRTFPVTKYYNSWENVVEAIITQFNWNKSRKGKNILFFVPWKKEIETYVKILKQKLWENSEVYPLHAEMPKEMQFALLKNTTWKPRIIVSTNVAEESITIDYVDLVYDLWTHKVLRYNHLWISELRIENTSKANSNQRAWRAWRTHEWEYIRTNETNFDDLRDFPEAPIEKEMLDRYILILLEKWIDIQTYKEEAEKNGDNLFFHNFNENLLKISLYRLRKLWAIWSNWKITKLWKNLLYFPLDVYHSRMLLEWIKRHCSEDMIYITAILEKKWFLSKDWLWKKIKIKSHHESDLIWYLEIIKLFLAKKLSSEKIRHLKELWLNSEELDKFVLLKGEKKLYECVNLEWIWVKTKRLRDIDILVDDLFSRFSSSSIPVENEWNIDDRKIAILSGSIHDIYEYDEKNKKFKNKTHRKGKETIYFTKGDISLVEKLDKSKLYLWVPFIIWGEKWKEDFNVLSFLTEITEWHISEVDKISVNLPWFIDSSVKWLTIEEAIENAAKWIENFSYRLWHDWFKKPEDAESFYLNKCLPELLIWKNVHIRKYLEWKTPEEIYIFKILLLRLLQNEKHRISHTTPSVTEKRFIHDTWIIEQFKESQDPDIIAFRNWDLESISNNIETDEIELKVSEFDWLNNREILLLQKQYAELVWKTKLELFQIDQKGIMQKIVEKYILHLESSSWEFAELNESYNNFSGYSVKNIQSVCKELKNIKKSNINIQKMHNHLWALKEFLDVIKLIVKRSSLKWIDQDYIDWFLSWAEFSFIKIDKVIKAISLFSSNDKRKHKRAVHLLENYFIPYIELLISKLEKEIDEITVRINLDSMPIEKGIYENLTMIISQFFEEEYYHIMVSKHRFDLLRNIVRDNITERKWLDKIIKEFLMMFKFTKSKELSWIFTLFEDYDSIMSELNDYFESVHSLVKESKDSEFINSKINEFEQKISEFEKLKKLVFSVLKLI